MTRYIRFRSGARTGFGILDGDTVLVLEGSLFAHSATTETLPVSEVKLLAPVVPGKILGVGLNYKSHLGGRPQPKTPEMFYKPVSALQNPGDPIVLPVDSTDVHYEGEIVAVLGRTVKKASHEEASAAIFGVTCGNDVSERQWQHGPTKDLQWWRAKGSDTFAPLGPAIVTGVDYNHLQLTTRLNGEVVQQQFTSDLIFDCAAIVSHVSRWVTLNAGDIIYTGTPGSTRRLSAGDVVEVEIENIGVLSNPVVAA